MNPSEIKKLRNILELSQKKFAKLFGSNYSVIQKWEYGTIIPSGFRIDMLKLLKEMIEKIDDEVDLDHIKEHFNIITQDYPNLYCLRNTLNIITGKEDIW